MSRPATFERFLLFTAEEFVCRVAPTYEDRLQLLEACASLYGGFSIEEFWREMGIRPFDISKTMDNAVLLKQLLSSIDIAPALAISSLSRESISTFDRKKDGVFYTDFRLAEFIAVDCAEYIFENVKIADIAAGSGILLAAIADRYYDLFPQKYNWWLENNVYAFDLSKSALRGARVALSVHASSAKSLIKMCKRWSACDSLLSDAIPENKFDVVVGNPPWGKTKLSLHSFINRTDNEYHVYGSQYGDYDTDRFLSEKQEALDYSKLLKEKYSLLGDAEPDMYMAFLQKAISVLKPNGHLSYIVPAGLIRSLGTEPLRKFLLQNSSYLKYYLLDNKANYFEIDTRFKFVIVSQNKTSAEALVCDSFKFEICACDSSQVQKTNEIAYNIDELKEIRPDLTIPECRDTTEKDLFVKIYRNGVFWKDSWKIDIAREVDMTNDRPLFHKKSTGLDVPVIEGRMVQQFRFGAKAYVCGSGRSAKWIPNPGSVRPQFYIDKEALGDALLERVYKTRVGYCDIAGQTNERAMMTTVIPAGVVCGNKVPTIVFPDDSELHQLYFFIGVTNSFVFDWVLRRVLSTTVNYFLLYSLPMPKIDLKSELALQIIAQAKSLCDMGAEYYTNDSTGRIRAELDVAVAKAYGLDFEDLVLILRDFPLLDRNQPGIFEEPRSTFTRDLFLATAEEAYGVQPRVYLERVKAASLKHSKAYIPSEMIELTRGGAKDE